jgi:peroxiredoxin Q/BCP
VLRDSYGDIQKTNTIILGVSVDDMETQKRFKEELGLPFELLSDSDKQVSKAFGVINSKGTRAQRKTFIIDPDGNIAYIFDKVNVSKHDEEVKEVLEKLQNRP